MGAQEQQGPLRNAEIAQVFDDISRLLEVKGDSPFKIRAYHNAARTIAAHPEELRDVVGRGGNLRDIPGIGEAIASKTTELVTTGRLEYFERLKESTPAGVLDLMQVPGIGPKTAGRLSTELGITSIEQLEKALRSGDVGELPGLGEKTARTILKEIEARRRRGTRRPIGTVLPVAERILTGLRTVPGVSRLTVAGSVRRFAETVGDVDLLGVCDSPGDVTARFVELDVVDRVLSHGSTRASVIVAGGLQVDLRIVEPRAYGSLLQHFTGSKEHNVALREYAVVRGLSVSEYGISAAESGEKELFGDEDALYRRLGLQPIPPEVRENQGEIELAAHNGLPVLVASDDIRGDLHVHTDWSDGSSSVEEMAVAGASRGYEYMAITDHSAGLGITAGVDGRRLQEQGELIRRVNDGSTGCTLLHGVEVNIRADGTLDLPDEVLSRLDFVVAAVHSALGQEREKMTARIIRALENPFVHALAHPSSRLLGQREPCAVDLPRVVETAVRTGTLLELNAMPDRLDLSAVDARLAHSCGALLCMGTDAHAPGHLAYLDSYGIGTARRAWCEPAHIANTLTLAELRRRLKTRPA